MGEHLKITLTRSLIGRKPNQKKTAQALGLRKINKTVIRPNNAAIQVMVRTISHMVRVEETE
ncbi:MAG: 50S ribosomal protein L30 [Spirochaetales bacterium]|nr:MAG: 50S ribosomal protein L30 [Spirochaetales bacterium]